MHLALIFSTYQVILIHILKSVMNIKSPLSIKIICNVLAEKKQMPIEIILKEANVRGIVSLSLYNI